MVKRTIEMPEELANKIDKMASVCHWKTGPFIRAILRNVAQKRIRKYEPWDEMIDRMLESEINEDPLPL